jgi:hypothetical protein
MRLVAAILLASVVNLSPVAAQESPRPLELVPSVRRGHSPAWTTGAIITFTSIGVSLMGAALTIYGIGNPDSGYGYMSNVFITGLVISATGDAGMLLAGPITWMAGMQRGPH